MNRKSFLKKKNRRWEITDKMFFSLFLTGSIIEFSQVGSGFIDGLVISKFLGPAAMAAEGIVHPIYSIMGIISGLLAVGMQVHCTQLIGRGNQKDLSRYFSSTVYVGTITSLLVTILVLIFAKPFAALLGASGNGAELLVPASQYLTGIGIGIPPLIMTAILAPAFQLDSGRKTIQTGAMIEAVADISLDFLAVKLGFGIIGVGAATAVASYLNLLYQCTHFLKKDRMLHFVRPNISIVEFLKMLRLGEERAFKRLYNTIRPIVLNTIIIAYGGAVAMSALSVRNSFSNFVEIFGAGIASAVALLTGLYYGEVNDEAIKAVNDYKNRVIAVFCGSVCVLLFLCAPAIARFYVSGDTDLCQMVTFAIRMLAIQNPLQALIASRIKYLQAIRLKFNMNLLIFTAQLAFTVLSAFVLGNLFGVYGILGCFTVSDLLTLFAIVVFYAIKSHKLIPSNRDLLALSDEFDLAPGDVISLDIRDEDDVTLASEQIMLFSKGHNLDRKTSFYAALCFEELAGNVVKHGFPNNRSAHPIIDMRAVITDKKFVIRMRDNCPQFDITKQIASANADDADPSHNIGIRIVSKLASDINYMHAFETNSLIISFDL